MSSPKNVHPERFVLGLFVLPFGSGLFFLSFAYSLSSPSHSFSLLLVLYPAVSVPYRFPSPTVHLVSIISLSLEYELPPQFYGLLMILAAT